jgi:AcrR family transcriptional regulator
MVKESIVRTRILEVASQLFYRQGYNATGINQVISEADIARASLYNHFPSKTDLLHAYLEQKDKKWFDALENYLAKRKGFREKILGIFDFRIERQTEQSFGGCPFVKASAEVSTEEKKSFELVNNHKEHLKAYIGELVSQIKPAPQSLDGGMLAETIFLLMEGATVMVNISKQKQSLLSARKIAQQLLG